jgi:capsular exopolysaccharide synthesis family protein
MNQLASMNMLSPKLDKIGAAPPQDPATRVEGDGEAPSVLQNYLRIAFRRRWVIAGAVAACILLGLVVTLLMTPKYTATSSIEISREADKVTDFQGVERDLGAADQEFYQTQYGLLQSRTLAERVANALNLVDDPKFFDMFGAPDEPAFQLNGGRYGATGRSRRQRVAGEILLDNVGIDPTRLSRLVDIQFTSPSAELSMRVANAWAENFIQSNLERKEQSTSYGREQLKRQLAEYKDRLDESQRQLVAYASAQQIINLPGQTEGAPDRAIVVDNLAVFNTALAQATADRIQAEARYRDAGRDGSTGEALTNAAINEMRAQRAELAAQHQQMMVRFEPGYPAAQALQSQIDDLDRSIAREESRVSGSLRANYQQALKREGDLQAKVSQLKQDYLDMRRRSIQYNIYQEEVDTNQALYDGLLQRFKEIGVAGGVGVNNVAIVDLANVPAKPSSPKLLLNFAISLFVGLLIGAALALALEQLDEAIADPTEVKRRLGLPLLGTVPLTRDEAPQEALLDRKSELVDAYLAVCTSLGFTTDHGVPASFAVTSTRPAEGKSTTALGLATTLARTGKRVILVDGDMRSPSIHHLAGVHHDQGLSNFLAGDDNIADLTFAMGNYGITAMSAGPIPPNAAELLTGNRLSVLIARLRESYDHVVIDSPPVMGLADAPLIGSSVEGVIYAVESHGIRSTQVKMAMSRLANANVRVLGCVLTKFEVRKSNYGYGYGYEYGYSYGRKDQEAETA